MQGLTVQTGLIESHRLIIVALEVTLVALVNGMGTWVPSWFKRWWRGLWIEKCELCETPLKPGSYKQGIRYCNEECSQEYNERNSW